jgi:hypothetical protein
MTNVTIWVKALLVILTAVFAIFFIIVRHPLKATALAAIFAVVSTAAGVVRP